MAETLPEDGEASATLEVDADPLLQPALSEAHQTVITGPEGEITSQDKFNLIRMTKADLEKFPNFNQNDMPDTIEKTATFINTFIETKRNQTNQRKTGTKRKRDDQGSVNEPHQEVVLEPLNLHPDVIAGLQTNGDDFKLMVFHSKSQFTCKGQEFTKTLVNKDDGEKIITNKWSSSLIYFFFRILEASKLPEIFIITIGQTWRIANGVALESFSDSIKEKDLEEETVYQYLIHTGGGKVFSTANQARAGEKLDSSTISPGSIVRNSTHFARGDAPMNKQTGFKQGSKVHIGSTTLSCSLTLDIENIHRFIKYISDTSKNYQPEKETKLQKVIDKALIEWLNKELINQLIEKDEGGNFCTSKHLQHEDASQWNKATQLQMFMPNYTKYSETPIKATKYNIPLSFRVVVGELTKRAIPQTQWLQIPVKWYKNKEPLKHFLEEYMFIDGTFYRYFFGDWYVVTYEYITDIDVQFKEVLRKTFLRASIDFPILPWIYKAQKDGSQSESSEGKPGKKTNKSESSGSKRGQKNSPTESSEPKKAKKTNKPSIKRRSAEGTSLSPAPTQCTNKDVLFSQASISLPSSGRDASTDKQKTTEAPKERDNNCDSAIGMTQSQSFSPNYNLSDTALQSSSQVNLSEKQNMTKTPQKNDNYPDSAVVVSQNLSLEQASVLSLPVSPLDADSRTATEAIVDATEIPKESDSVCDSSVDMTQTQPLNDLAEKDGQPSLLEQATVTSSDVIVDIGKVGKGSKQEPGFLNKNFQTETIKIKNDIETIHYPVKVDFNRALWEPTKDENEKEIRVSYSAYVSEKYVENNCTKDELEDLLFLRLNTALFEGGYNNTYVIYNKLLKEYGEERFIIIPGDEVFVAHKNTELYDILISDEEKKITYVVQVKAGFGHTTRDACSQIRLSAQKIRQSILYKSSRSVLEQYWRNNTRGPSSVLFNDYKHDVGRILHTIGKEKFLDLFRDEHRRLVFVFGCRDDRKSNLQMEAERASSTDTVESAENVMRKSLREKDSLPQAKIEEIIDILKLRQILNTNGQVTNIYMFQTGDEKKELLEEIAAIVQRGSKKTVKDRIRDLLDSSIAAISGSDIAKCELINLENQFREFCVGRKQFELKICQIPMKFYLRQRSD